LIPMSNQFDPFGPRPETFEPYQPPADFTPPGVKIDVVRILVAQNPSVWLDVRVCTPVAPIVPNGEAVLMLHGFPEFWGTWLPQIVPLVDAGYTLVIPDQRGYNNSSKPPTTSDGKHYTLPILCSDAIAVLDYLKANTTPERKDVHFDQVHLV